MGYTYYIFFKTNFPSYSFSFYRFVLSEEPQFAPSGDYGVAPFAKFSGLPTSPLFTLAMATPENWLVEVVKSPYDLDNIHLEQVSKIFKVRSQENLLSSNC